jgi:hypothetical protein
MFETLLDSGRRSSVPTRHAAVSSTLHASALIGAFALTRVSSVLRTPIVPRAARAERVTDSTWVRQSVRFSLDRHGH